MNKVYETVKLATAVVFSIVAGALGGADSVLTLLVVLIACDIITGLINAITMKTVSSTEMRNGIIRKLLIFLVIIVAVKIDKCIIDFNGAPIELFGKAMYVRTLFVIYSCLEEGISLLENLANIGVPVPRWVRSILVQVSDCANNSTPKVILKWLKKVLGITIKGIHTEEDSTVENEDEDDESE